MEQWRANFIPAGCKSDVVIIIVESVVTKVIFQVYIIYPIIVLNVIWYLTLLSTWSCVNVYSLMDSLPWKVSSKINLWITWGQDKSVVTITLQANNLDIHTLNINLQVLLQLELGQCKIIQSFKKLLLADFPLQWRV